MTGEPIRGAALSAGKLSAIGLPAILAATYFLFAPASAFPFVYDDIFQIAQNPHLDSWRFLPVYFTQHVWSHIPQIPPNFYRPLFLVWLRLNTALFDREPAGWHTTSIFLHMAATGLVYLLALALLKKRPAALIAAAVFAFHPIHTEAVAWVSGVPEPLSTVFFLGSFLCYLRMRAHPARRGLWLAGSLISFAAALLCKETAAVLPLVIAAYELTLGRAKPIDSDRESGGHDFSRAASPAESMRLQPLRNAATNQAPPSFVQRCRQLLPYGALLAVYFLVRAMVLGGFTHRMTSVPLRTSILTWPWLVCFYVRQLVWPSGLSPLYDVNYASGLGQPGFIFPVLAICAAALAIWWMARRSGSGLPSFLAAWFLITLAPAAAIFCLALPAEAFHDRYQYLPSLAFALALGAVFSRAVASPGLAPKLFAGATAAFVLSSMAVGTHRQTAYWASNYVLFQRALAIAPRNDIAEANFAAELIKTREYDRALRLSQAALVLHPESIRALASAAAASSFLGDYSQAETYYSRAVAIDPTQGTLFHSLGLTRMKLGRYEEAKAALRQALAADPQQPAIHYAIGLADAKLGEWDKARSEFQEELLSDPNNQEARKELLEVVSKLPSAAPKAVLHRVGLSSNQNSR